MEYQDLPARRFTREELGEVIELATRLEQSRQPTDDPGVSYQDLRTIAAELGISDAVLLEAVAARLGAGKEEAERRRAEAKRAANWRKRVRAWKVHLGVYLSTMAGLFVIDIASDGAIDFVMYPAAGWGIAVLIHGVTTWAERPTGADPGS